MRLTRRNFQLLQMHYGLLMDFCISNPIVPAILNDVARPSQLEGFVSLLLERTPEYFLPQMLASLLESEFVFISQHTEPFVFLRERSRISARATGDVCQSACRRLLIDALRELVLETYYIKIRDAQNYQLIEGLAIRFLEVVFALKLPEIVQFLIKEVFVQSQKYNLDKYAYMLCGNLLFLRLICPAISIPEFYGVVDQKTGPPSYPARKALILIGKILNQVGNFAGGAYTQLDDEMEPFRQLIERQAKRFCAFIDQIVRYTEFSVKRFVDGQLSTNFVSGSYYGQEIGDSASYCQENKMLKEGTLMSVEMLRASFLPGLNTDVLQLNLRILALLHHSLLEHKSKIFDVCYSVTTQQVAVSTAFDRYIDCERFTRVLGRFVEFWRCERDGLTYQLATLLDLLETPPPVLYERDYFSSKDGNFYSKYYRVIKENSMGKKQRRIVKFTSDSLLNIDADDVYGILAARRGIFKKTAFPVIKNEMTGQDIELVETADRSIRIEFSEHKIGENIGKQQKRLPRTYYFDDNVTRDYTLGEIIEMCFMAVGVADLYHGVWIRGDRQYLVNFKLGKDCILMIDDDKIVYDTHVADIYSVQDESNVLSMQIKGTPELLVIKVSDKPQFVAKLLATRELFLGSYKPDLDTVAQ